jgi:nucleoside-diphosphate-sugar epimerase
LFGRLKLHILVTGGAGYIGTVLIERLIREGHNIQCLDRRANEVPALLNLTPGQLDRFTPVPGDVRDATCVKAALKSIDCVVHLASVVGYPACDADPDEAHSTNIEGTRRLVELISLGVPLVFLSTCSIYGRLLGTVCRETSAVRPLTIYGKTKAIAEKIVLDAGGVALRPVTAFGRSFRVRPDLLAHTLTQAGLAKGRLKIFEPEAIRPFIHVTDLAEAIHFALQHATVMQGNAYNVGSEEGTLTKLQLVQRIAALTDLTFEIDDNAADPDNRSYYVSFKRIENLGFRTRLPFQHALEDTVNWLRAVRVEQAITA